MNLQLLLKNRIVVSLVLAYLIVIVVAGIAYEKLNAVVKDSEQLKHSHEVLRNVQNVFVDMLDAETGYRGFVITGDPALLSPYTYAENTTSEDIRRLLASTEYDSSKYHNALLLEGLVQRKLQRAREIISLRIHYGLDSTMLNMSVQSNKHTMDSIRMIRARMENTEWDFLNKSNDERIERAHYINLLYVFLVTVIMVLFFIIYFFRRNELLGREKAEEYNRRLAAIVETSSDAIIYKTPGMLITAWNKGAERLYGYTAKEVIGQPVSLLVPHELADEEKNILEQMQRGSEMDHFETTRIAKNGKLIPVSMSLSAIHDEQGRLTGISTIARDISERREFEEQIIQTNTFLDTVLENIPNMIFIKDANELRFVRFNKAGEKLLGFSKNELLGKNDYDFFPNEEADFFIKKDKEVLDKGIVLDIPEESIHTKNGLRWLHTIKISITDESGKPLYLMGISEDITERKMREDIIKELNQDVEKKVVQLTAMNQELESFSYSVSHDLRTPLRAIDGYSRILDEDYGDKLDENGKRVISVVLDNTRRMAQLIDDLLAFSRLGREGIHRARVNMQHLVNATIAEMEKIFPDKSKIINSTPLPDAFGDESMLLQVWANLIANALKYSSTRAESHISISAEQTDSEIIYSIKDNGVGFSMAYYDKLFGVFQRLHSVEEFEGTGVGLAIVQRIVHRHNGRVWAISRVDEGATFYFSLPKGTETKE
jgi:PAS domain S-box-containing protein